MKEISTVKLDTDILIIGGGAAGCMAAIEAKKLDQSIKCIVMEKAHIERSGCLAMGLNAINAYLNTGQTPETYVMDAESLKKHFAKGSVRVIYCSVMRHTRLRLDPRQIAGHAGHA